MRAWQQACADGDRAYGAAVATIDARFSGENAAPDNLFLQLLDGVHDRLLRPLGFRPGSELPHRRVADLVQGTIARHLVCDAIGVAQTGATNGRHRLFKLGVLRHRHRGQGGLADRGRQLLDRTDRHLHLLVTIEHRPQHDLFGKAPGLGLDHEDTVLGTGHHQVQVGVRSETGNGRIEQVYAVLVADAGDPDGAVEGGTGHRQRRRGAEYGRELRIDRRVEGLHGGDDLDFLVIALRKKRPDRAVHEPGGEDLGLARPALTAEEAPRNAAGGVGFLLIVHGHGKEVTVGGGALVHHDGDQDDRLAHVDEYGTIGLAGDLAGLEGYGVVSELKGLFYGCHWLFLGVLVVRR